ncbi:hypothetical protein [Kiloniella sp.]|uniref:hypothetical protein n=1 Tax=Kiloniella sp. TaxID=1938587 RepID=UPI003B020D5D
MKYQIREDLTPDQSIGFSPTDQAPLKNNLLDKIQLTPTPYAVFKVLSKARGQEMDYRTLKIKSGMGAVNSFPKHIQELVAKGVVQCLGPHRDRYVILKVDPARVELVQRYARKTSQHSRPEINTKTKERKCLSCQKKFKSEWAGMRICTDCKTTPAWQDPDNPYTPEGDTDGSGLSDLTTGLY